MKKTSKHPSRFRERPWLWIPVCAVFALFIYFAGAVFARVMFERGTLRQGSPTFRAVVILYKPLQVLADSSPAFGDSFERCVGIFVPKEKAEE